VFGRVFLLTRPSGFGAKARRKFGNDADEFFADDAAKDDAAQRVEKPALEQDVGGQTFGDPVQSDKRRPADGFDDVVVNASHKISSGLIGG